jgi:hypothetical protein
VSSLALSRPRRFDWRTACTWTGGRLACAGRLGPFAGAVVEGTVDAGTVGTLEWIGFGFIRTVSDCEAA